MLHLQYMSVSQGWEYDNTLDKMFPCSKQFPNGRIFRVQMALWIKAPSIDGSLHE